MDSLKEIQEKAKYDRGIQEFEKRVGRINWLHPSENDFEYKLINMLRNYGSAYVVRLKSDESIAYIGTKLLDIAKEFDSSPGVVSKYVNTNRVFKNKYIIERVIENEVIPK